MLMLIWDIYILMWLLVIPTCGRCGREDTERLFNLSAWRDSCVSVFGPTEHFLFYFNAPVYFLFPLVAICDIKILFLMQNPLASSARGPEYKWDDKIDMNRGLFQSQST